MSTYARPSGYVIGTAGSPVTYAAASTGNASSSIVLGTGTSVFNAVLHVQVGIGATAPTTVPTVQFQYCLDTTGTEWLPDPNATFAVPITAVSTTYDYDYTPNPSVQAIRVVVNNPGNASITALAHGNTLGGP